MEASATDIHFHQRNITSKCSFSQFTSI